MLYDALKRFMHLPILEVDCRTLEVVLSPINVMFGITVAQR